METSLDIIKDNLLKFSKISLNAEYSKKWNNHHSDFILLTKNGEVLRDTLYRIGGLNYPNLNKDRYFMLLKHEEAYYPNNITKIVKDKPHLASMWCILDIYGNEKIVFKPFEHPYLKKNSCLYSVDSKYYNIETGEYYGSSSNAITSKEFVFLDNSFHPDKSKRGVLKVNLNDGSKELFPA